MRATVMRMCSAVAALTISLLSMSPPVAAQKEATVGLSPQPTDKDSQSGATAHKPQAASDSQGGLSNVEASALQILRRGNEAQYNGEFRIAIDLYQEALGHLEHPAIYYNLMLAYTQVKDSVNAFRSAENALRFGPKGLETWEYTRAKEYHDLLSGQVHTVIITCDKTCAKAEITLGGEPMRLDGGRAEKLVKKGKHQLIVKKLGYRTVDATVAAVSGKEVRIAVRLYSLEELIETRYRWKRWMPWSAVVAGAALGVLGGELHLRARDNFISFDNRFKKPGVPSEELRQLYATAELQQRVAFGSYTIGGAVLLSGLVMAYLNQPQVFERDLTEVRYAMIPYITGESTGIVAGFTF